MSSTKYTGYKTPFPVGVKLPEIKIEKKYYDEVSCADLGDNFQFLRKLCFKRIQEKGIDKLENAQIYFDRLKEELATFKDLGFVDYILLNWDILNYCEENDNSYRCGARECRRIFGPLCYWGDENRPY